MRIQIIADSYVPSTKSSAKLLYDLSVEFTRQGHQVFVAVPGDTLSVARSISREPQATVLRVRSGRTKGSWKPLRALHELRLSSLLWKRGRDFFEANPCDLIVFYSPTIFFASLVERLKRLWKCPAYLVLRDIFPQWAVDTGVMRRGLVYRCFRKHELAQYAAADVIGVQSPANLDYFRQNGWREGHALEVLYNWCGLDQVETPEINHRQRWDLGDKVVFFYGGNIGVAQDIDNVLRLAGRLRDEPTFHLLLVGDGSEVRRLRNDIRKRDLTNVTWRPAVSQREYSAMLSEFDVGIISLSKELKTHNFPGKMLGYMAAGLPILASINLDNDLKQVLEEHEAGLVYLNGNDEALHQGARQLVQSPDLRRRLGRNGRTLLERKFSASTAAAQITSRFGSVQPQVTRQAA